MSKSFFARFWIYQQERFPLVSYVILVGLVVLASFGYSTTLRRASHFAGWGTVVAAFVVVLGFFLQLRIADEFKDYGSDLAFRPYRPVPRGLIHLSELQIVALVVAALQALLAIWLGVRPFVWLLFVWLYMLLMRYEFGLEQWLKHRPVLYLLSHMVVMPLIFGFIVMAEWRGTNAPVDLYVWFLGVAYVNGIVFEIGRKIRAPADEEIGVETYSRLWRPRTAVLVWLIALLASTWLAVAAANLVDGNGAVAIALAAMLMVAGALSARFLRAPTTGRGKWFEWFASAWLLVVYAVLGIVPAIRWLLGG